MRPRNSRLPKPSDRWLLDRATPMLVLIALCLAPNVAADVSPGGPIPVPIAVDVDATKTVLDAPGDTAGLTVTATFPDGNFRDVSGSELGTMFGSEDPTIVTVEDDGSLTAVSRGSTTIFANFRGVLGSVDISVEDPNALDENCTVSVFNRTVQVNPNGTYAVPNVPAAQGLFRIRASCIFDGVHFAGASPLVVPVPNGVTPIGQLELVEAPPIPVRIDIESTRVEFDMSGQTAQLTVRGTLPDGRVQDYTEDGAFFQASNPQIGTVSQVGLYSAVRAGTVVVTARVEGAVTTVFLRNIFGEDGDGDGLPDDYERSVGLDPTNPDDAGEDPDNDGLDNRGEFEGGTDPFVQDTDGDGLFDGDEIGRGTNPLVADTDGDGLLDREEVTLGSNPLVSDTDGDGLPDGTEVALGLDPQNEDSDGDGTVDADEDSDGDNLTNRDELVEFTNPGLRDTDGDGLDDGEEVVTGADGFVTDPVNPDTDGDGMRDGCESGCLVDGTCKTCLDPTDPADRDLDQDMDSLTNVQECLAGSDPCSADDVEGPKLTSHLPEDGATDVDTTTDIVLDFDEPVNASTVNNRTIVLFQGTQRVTNVSYSRSNDNRTVTIPNNLQPGVEYSVFVTRGLRDLDGNPAQEDSFRFTTGAPPDNTRPVVAVVRPVNGARQISTSKCVTVFFSEPIREETVTADSFTVSSSAGAVSGSITVDDSGTSATLCPDEPLAFNTRYTVRALTAIQDLAGVGLSNFSSSFTTRIDPAASRPEILSIKPLPNTTGVPTNADILARFNEPLDEATVVQPNFTARVANVDVPGSISVEEGGTLVRFTPDAPFPPSTTVSIRVTTAILDLDGDALGNSQFYNITTGDGPDSSAPSVVEVGPLDGLTGIGTNGLVKARFSERINCVTVSPDSFLVVDDEGNVVPCSITFRQNDTIAIFTPQSPLKPDTEYTVTLTSAIEDIGGNSLAESTSSFTTGPGADVTRPVVVAVNPSNGSTGNAINTRIGFLLSKPMSRTGLIPASLRVTASGVPQVTGELSMSENRRVIYFDPAADLEPNLTYNVRLERDDLCDDSGNAPFVDIFFSFATGSEPDSDGPSVALVSPIDGLVGVGVNAPLFLRFDEGVDITTINVDSIRLSMDGGPAIPGTYSLSQDFSAVTFRPSSLLTPSSTYDVTVLAGEYTDLAGNPGAAFSSSFTTASSVDVDVPVVTFVSPANGHSNVKVDSPISVQFSKPINEITLTPENFLVTARIRVPGVISLSADRRRATFTPMMPYPVSHSVSIRIRRDVLDDAGNRLNNNSDFFSSFTTEFLQDDEPPTVELTNPVAGDVLIAPNTPLWTEFDGPIDQTSVNSESIRVVGNGVEIPGSFSFEELGRVVKFTPRSELPQDTEIQTTISGVRDEAGNTMASTFITRFRTGTAVDTVAPRILLTNPKIGTTGISLEPAVGVTFSEPMNFVTTDRSKVAVSGSGAPPVRYTVELSGDGRQLSIRFDRQLLPDVQYSVSIATTATDRAGNRLAGNHFWFVTGRSGDTTGPTVVATTPNDGASEIGGNTPVAFQCDEPINPNTVDNQTVRITADLVEVLGSFEFSSDLRIVTLQPFNLLQSGKLHTVILDGVEDVSGNPMTPFEFSFTTAATGNLAESDDVLVEVSSFFSGSFPGRNLVDGNIATSWFTANNDEAPTAEIIFLQDIAVERIEVLNPRSHPTGFDFLTGRLAILDAEEQTLWESGLFSFDVGDFQDAIVDVPGIGDARRVLFSGEDWQSIEPGLAEIRVIGSFEDPTTGIPERNIPTVISVDPPHGATDVPHGTPVAVEFSEPMNPLTFTRGNFFLSMSGVGTYPTDVSFNDNATVATLTPVVPFPPEAVISVVATTSIQDANGNNLSRSSSTSFTVAAGEDNTEPLVVSIVPENGTRDVRTTQRVTILLSKPTSPATVNANNIGVYANGTRISSSIARSADGTAIELRGTWLPNASHTVYVGRGLTDLVGNPLPAAITSRFDTSGPFDTTAPILRAVRPPNAATNVPVDQPVHAIFAESIDGSTLDGRAYLATVAAPGRSLVDITTATSPDGVVATLTPSTLDPGQGYQVFLRAGIRDLSGNSLRSNLSSTFTTRADPTDTQPSLQSISPSHGATGVARNASVFLRFSESIARDSIDETTLFLTQDGVAGTLPATYSFAENDRIVGIHPNDPFQPTGAVRVRIRTAILDLQGQNLAFNQSLIFTPVDVTDSIPPTVELVSPGAGLTDIGTNARIQIRLSEPAGAASVYEGSIVLKDADGEIVPCSVLLSQSDRVITFTPHCPLREDTDHTVCVRATLRDRTGNALVEEFNSAFRTGGGIDFVPPHVARTAPINGATRVPVNAPVIVDFTNSVNPISVTQDNVVLSSSPGILMKTLSLDADRRRLTITPTMPLPAGRHVSVRLRRAITDDSSNELRGGSDYFFSFTAQHLPDTTPPTIVAVSPLDGAEDVPINARGVVTFGEAMDATSIFGGALRVAANGSPVAGTLSLQEAGRKLVFAPETVLDPNTTFLISVGTTAKDLAGNPLASAFESTFRTSDTADLVAPRLIAISPPNGSTNVPTNVEIRWRSSEPLNAGSVNGSTVILTASGIGNVPIDVHIDSTGTEIRVTPRRELTPQTSHSLSIRSTIEDYAGNRFQHSGITFTTGTGVSSPGAPTVLSILPADGAADVSGNAQITFEFDRRIDALTFNASALAVESDGNRIPGTYSLSPDLRKAIFRPLSSYSTSGSVSVELRDVTDLAGTPMSAAFSSSFSVDGVENLARSQDAVANASSFFSATYPPSNAFDGKLETSWFTANGDAANLGESPFVEITLPEDAAVSELRMYGLRSHPDGFDFFSGIFQLFDAAGTELYTSGDVALPAPDRDLVLSFAEVTGVRRARFTATDDESVEPGLGELEVIGRFESGNTAGDRDAPQIAQLTPPASASGVDVGVEPTIRFTDAMDLGCTERAFSLGGGGIVWRGSFSWNAAGTELVYTPDTPLLPNTSYNLRITGVATDRSGNSLNGGSGLSYFFTTGPSVDDSGPSLVSVSPEDGSTLVAPRQPAVFDFSEPLSSSSFTADHFAAYNEGARLNVSITRSADYRRAILTATWPTERTIQLVVSGNVVDVAGNPMGADRYSSITIAPPVDTAAPRVHSIRPASGASGVARDKAISVILTEPATAASVPGAVFLSDPAGKLVDITVSSERGDSVLLLRPNAPLAFNTRYTVFVTPSLRDRSLMPFSNFSTTFTTRVDRSALQPDVVAYTPFNGENSVPLNTAPTARFSEPLDVSTVDSSSVSLTPSGGAAVPGVISFAEGNRVVVFTPSSALEPDVRHVLRFESTIADTHGDTLRFARAISFTTDADGARDDAPPTVEFVNPADGQLAVPVNAIAAVRFGETINTMTISTSSFELSTAAGDLVACNVFFEQGNKVVFLTPNQPLAENVEHTLSLSAQILDRAGNALGADHVTMFTTRAAPDLVSPIVVGNSPVANTAGVPVSALVRMRLSEPVSPVHVTRETVILTASGIGAIEGAVSLSADGMTIEFQPNEALPADRFHSLRLNRAIRDTAGNLLRNGSGHSFGFTTGDAVDATAPSIVASTPEDGTGAIPLNLFVRVEFDAPIDRTTVDHGTFDLEDASGDVPGRFGYDAGDRIVRFFPTSLLDPASSYTLTIDGVQDTSGNSTAAATVIEFTTGDSADLVAPRVAAYSPPNGARDVDVGTDVTIDFTEPVCVVRLGESLRFTASGIGDVPFSWSISPDRLSITITPDAPLSPGRFHSISVSTVARDLAGNTLAFHHSTGFTTAP